MSGSIPRVWSLPAWRPDRGEFEDRVVVEEPLEIRLDGFPLAVTLRTPGEDEELAAGFVFTEGIVRRPRDVERVERIEDGPADARGNVVDVRLAGDGASAAARATGRPSFITSACGVCGRGTIDAVRRRAEPLPDGPRVGGALLADLPERLRGAQVVFAQTGGLHAAGLFDAEGRLLLAREDVGRHNAVDKVVGHGVLARSLPWSEAVLAVSGRTGFEIVLKAWMAGIPVLASVSAPSHLAVRLAEEAGMALVGFVRGGGYTVYAGRERIRT